MNPSERESGTKSRRRQEKFITDGITNLQAYQDHSISQISWTVDACGFVRRMRGVRSAVAHAGLLATGLRLRARDSWRLACGFVRGVFGDRPAASRANLLLRIGIW